LNLAWKSRYDLAVEAAQQAGKIALGYFDMEEDPVRVEWKPNDTPVTVADREAEEYLQRTLLGMFPNDGFWGEEFGEVPGSSGYRWIIDPIDGTRSFVRGIPLWGTLVGLEYKGEQIAGVTRIPALKQTFRALRGDGAYRDDRRIRVSEVSDFGHSQVFYSGINWFMNSGSREAFLDLVGRTQRQRGFGDFYGFCLVAQGSGEMMLEYGVKPWDIAALRPLVEEAGGRFSDWEGTPTIQRPDILASNGKLHEETLVILKSRFPPGFSPGTWQNVKDVT
jgi:histidinol-phosphatase